MKDYSIVGKPVDRVDGPVKATGEAKYTDDMILPRMLYGKILRSPLAHASILNIDTSRAQRLPGVKAVITGKDTLGIKFGNWRTFPELMDELPLAIDKVRFIGDEIAAVAAIDKDTAEEALKLIKVEYEELPAVFDPMEAIKEGAPKIHDNVERNISVTRKIEWGNVEEGFKKSSHIREDKFFPNAVNHAYLEPNSALASFEPSGRLTLWTSTQVPYMVKCLLAMTLGLRENDVRVIKPYVGGGFGGKMELTHAQFCSAFLSMKTGRPVKITYTRKEEFAFGRRRHPMIMELKTGVKKDGTLMAKQCRIHLDGGAYNSLGPTATFLAGMFSIIPYSYPNYKYDGYRIYTNKPPSGAMRGFGAPQAVFATESQMDMIAEDLGIDPIELRLKNAMQPGEKIPGLASVGSCGFTECINKVAEQTGWKEKRGKLPDGHGIGIGCYGFLCGGVFNWFNTPYPFSSAEVRANPDGTVNFFTQAADIGQGADTVLCQILAEELGIAMEDIKLTTSDTDTTPVDLGAWGSRTTFMMGNAVIEAARDIKRQLFGAVAQKLELNVIHDLEAKERRIRVKGDPKKGITFAEAVAAAQRANRGMAIIGRGSYTPRGKGLVTPALSFGAQVAEVEVDRETGVVKVNKVTTAHDCGQVINPLGVEGQLDGSIQMGLGYALSEQFHLKEGKTLNTSFLDYKIPSAIDMPDEVESIIVETNEPEGPFGAKEAAEGLVGPTAPAIANAIYDAVGFRAKELPITPEKILLAPDERQKPQRKRRKN